MRHRVNEKPKDIKRSIKMLLSRNKEYLIYILIALILAGFSSILTIYGPDRLKDITNIITEGIMTGIDLDKIMHIAFILIFIYSLSAIFDYVQSFIMATISSKLTFKLRNEISKKINRLPLKYFDNHSYGDILSRITNDVDMIGHTMNSSITNLVSSVSLFISSLIMMFVTNWIMAFTAILATFIGFLFMFLLLSKSQKYFNEVQENLGMLNGHIEETYSGHNVVNVYNAKEETLAKFDEINNNLYKNARKSQFLSGLMQPLMSFIGNLGYVCVCIVGSILTVNGHIEFGTIVAFMMYVRYFTNPLTHIAQSLNHLQSTFAASERVFEFLEEVEMSDESNFTKYLSNDEVKGIIEFKNVNFGYDEKLIIKDFNLKTSPGDKIAIVGPTGAGKTTLVNLLMKFYDINSGDILIDGISIKELTRENVNKLFVMVLQDSWLFNGTIEENIRYNKENVTNEDIINACKVVGVDHFINTLPNGYNTLISDAESISAGQKQLLTIARGMIENAPFLILDEATSSVDTRTEVLVQKAMDKLTEGKTSFIIAHRLSTIKNADLILVMKDGNIIEQGNHEELLNKNGFYAELYNSQFQTY